MITLYKEYTIGVKMLSDAELNRESSPSGQTHIGLSEKVLTYLPNTPIQQEGILVVNQSCSFVECAFSKINKNRSTKVDSLTTNPVKSVVKQIRNIASNAENHWFLIWFALENQTPVFWLLNDKSEDYEDLSGILEKSQNLTVYTASKEEYFVLLSKVRSIKKLQSAIESKYNVSQENRLIAVSSEHRTFVHLCTEATGSPVQRLARASKTGLRAADRFSSFYMVFGGADPQCVPVLPNRRKTLRQIMDGHGCHKQQYPIPPR